MRNPCSKCIYYHPENNTCQSKKCATGGAGYVTWVDRRYCDDILEVDAILKCNEEHSMEEFMYGQDMGNPEDGSL